MMGKLIALLCLVGYPWSSRASVRVEDAISRSPPPPPRRPGTPLQIDGLVAAVVTPMHQDGSLNVDAVNKQAEYLAATNVSHVFLAGTTGQSVSLSVDERKSLTEKWESVAGAYGIQYIIHVGAESINDVVSLTQHAASHGAAAVGVMPSVFFKPATIEALGQWVETVASNAPDLPVYYYHIPSQTGVEFDMLDLLQEMDSRNVGNFAGVKDTGLYETRAFPDLMRCNAYVTQRGTQYEMLCGREELMIEAQSIGTTGFIGSQFNFAGDIYASIHAEEDQARKTAKQLAAIELLYAWIDGVPSTADGNKAMTEIAGVPVGPPRLPMLPMSNDEMGTLRMAVRAWCSDTAQAATFEFEPKICQGA